MATAQQRKGQKRKLGEDPLSSSTAAAAAMAIDVEERAGRGEIHLPLCPQNLVLDVKSHIQVLQTRFSWLEADRLAAKRATHVLAELAKNGIPSIFGWNFLAIFV